MSLILCSRNEIKHPLYIEGLGISIYSIQELSYVIYNHPFMVMEGFINERLILFLEELDLNLLAAKLKQEQKEKKAKQEELLLYLLQESHYYSALELNKYKEQLISFRRMHPAELAKLKADYYFSRKRFGFSIPAYKEILESERDSYMDDSFISRVWNNLGAAYGSLFWYNKSMEAYEKSYQLVKNSDVLRHMYLITKMEPTIEIKQNFLLDLSEESKEQYNIELDTILNDAAFSEESKKIDWIFLKEQESKIEESKNLYNCWKQEYRNMIL